jgi:hypothetical protein
MQKPDGLFAAALEYASRGWPVLPLVPSGKKPLTKHGHLDATTDPDQIAAWWAQHPRANVGIVTGARSGILVLDVDSSDGDLALIELGAAVPTLTSVTAKGKHLYFVHAPAMGCCVALRPGLDVRGDGGYVVAPPSVHESGFVYRWDDEHFMGWGANLAPLPESLHQILLENHRPPKASLGGGVLREGQRNVGLTKFAGSVAAGARHLDEVLEAVLASNQARCRPPLSPKEVTDIAKSIWRRECESRHDGGRPRQGTSLRQPDAIITLRWATLHLLEPKDLAALGYLLDLVRLIETNAEMPINTGHGNTRAAWVGAGTAELAIRFLCNRWALTTKRVRTMLTRWEELGLVRRLKPRAGRKQGRIRIEEGWAHIDPTGADLFAPTRANLQGQLDPCHEGTKVGTPSSGSDTLSRGDRATSTNKKGECGDGGGRAEERKRDPEWLGVGPFEVLA